MQFYTKKHNYYCGIDLHTKIIYLCVLNSEGEVQLHKQTHANPESLMRLIKPYLDDLVITVECMFTWYWVSDFCHKHKISFVLGHALYMKAIHGGKAKNDKIDFYKIAKLINSGLKQGLEAYYNQATLFGVVQKMPNTHQRHTEAQC